MAGEQWRAINANVGSPGQSLSIANSAFNRLGEQVGAKLAQDKADALQQEQLKYTRDRQEALDFQNRQLFNAKMADIARAGTDRANEAAYLKGVTQPGAYGLKAGTENVVNQLSQYTGDNPRAKAALAAGPGTKEYEAYFADMAKLGDTITGQSMDDRAIGFATANPNNTFAAKEALKASIARQNALDTELKTVNANKLKYDLEALKNSGTTSTSRGTSKTAGGYSVKDPGSVLKDAFSLVKTQYGKKTEDSIDPKVAKQATFMADAGYDASQIAKAINASYTPSKTETFLGIDWLNPDSAASFSTEGVDIGTPRNVSASNKDSTEYTNRLSGLSNTYANRIAQLEKQRSGNYGIDELEAIKNYRASVSAPSGITAANTEDLGKPEIDEFISSNPGKDESKNVQPRKGEDKNIQPEVAKAVDKVSQELEAKFKRGELSPLENTLRKMGLHKDQRSAADAIERRNSIAKFRAEQLKNYKSAQANKRIEEIAKRPEVIKGYQDTLRSMARTQGYVGTGTMPDYSILDYVKDKEYK